jgi:hypothetical protein
MIVEDYGSTLISTVYYRINLLPPDKRGELEIAAIQVHKCCNIY